MPWTALKDTLLPLSPTPPPAPHTHTLFQADGIVCGLPFRVHLFSNNTLVFLVVKIAASIKTCFFRTLKSITTVVVEAFREESSGWRDEQLAAGGAAVVIGQLPSAQSCPPHYTVTSADSRSNEGFFFFLKMMITPRPPRGQRAVSRPRLHRSQSPPMLASAK